MKIFLSSTFKDLEAYRAAVITQLRGLDGVTVLNMENFGARPESPKDFSMQMARECDLFIGLIGHLYGHIPPGDDTSITELEYQAAVEAGKDRLVFVAPDDFQIAVKLLLADGNLAKQEHFRGRVLTEATANLSWSTPEALARGVLQAVYNWRQNHADAAKPPLVIAGVDQLAYANRCRVRWETIDLSTLAMPGALDTNVDAPRLSQVFIPQDCRRSRPAVSLPRDYLEKQGLDSREEERLLNELRTRWEQQERLPSLDLLAKSDVRNVVLLGDPGAGKSSLTRFVLLQLLNPTPAESPWRQALDGTWPVLVELRDFLAREAEGKCGDLIGYLGHVGETQGFGYDLASLEAQLRDRPSLLIVDGLDEVFELRRRRSIVEEIVGLETRFPQMRVLVTSRIAGFNAQPFESAGFTIATLDDLSENQIQLFAGKWFGLAFPGEPEKAERSRADLLEAIERRPQLAAIAGNPLILTIMAIIARHKRLARSRTQLYGQALEVLCYAWDYRRGLELPADSPLADLQPDDTLLMLRRVAWRMQESAEGLRANAIGEDELRSILVEFFERDWHFPPPKAGRAGAEMVKLLQERNWVLTTRGPQLYGFVHRTFLEYLCALELTQRFAEQSLTFEMLRDSYVLPRAEDDSYTEVIRLLCGRLPVKFADELIAAICPSPDEVIRQEQRLLLAWQALGELEPRTLGIARNACDAAINGLYRWISEWTLSSEHKIPSEIFVDAINTIEPGTWPSSTIESKAFPFTAIGYQFVLTDILLDLARTIWLPIDSVRNKLFAASESDNWMERRGSIAVIRYTMKESPEIYQLLLRRWKEDEHEEVRATAAGAVLRSSYVSPEIIDFAIHQARHDESRIVRSTIISTLANLQIKHVALLDLFVEWGESDEEIYVRRDALRGIGNSRPYEPRATAVLQRMSRDSNVEIRRATLIAWAQALKSHLEGQLLSLDLDALDPGLDPAQIIDHAQIQRAAKVLNEQPDTIRVHYERLVREEGIPLRLEWLPETLKQADEPTVG